MRDRIGFDWSQLSTKYGLAGAILFSGMEVMPESWKPIFVVLMALLFGVSMFVKDKAPADLVPRHDIPDEKLPDDLQDLIDLGKR